MQQMTSSNQLLLAWAMFLFGLSKYQPEMGMEKYAWKTEGDFYSPASIFPPRHYMQGSMYSIYSITTRSSRSKTVMSNYDDVQLSDMNMFWKIQYPTKNYMGLLADIARWNFPATKKRCYGDTAVITATLWPSIGRKENSDHNTVENLMGKLDEKGSLSRQHVFDKLRDTFKMTVNGIPQVDGQDIGLPPPQLALVTSTVQVPQGQKRKNFQQTPPTDIPAVLTLMLKAAAEFKAEMGAVRESIKILSAGLNGTTPAAPKRSRTQIDSDMYSFDGPASGRAVVYSSRLQPVASDPHGFGRPRPGGPRQISYGELSQRNFEEDCASSASKDSLTTSARLLSVEDTDTNCFVKASRLSKRNGVYISPAEEQVLDLAQSNSEDYDSLLKCTGFSTTTFTTADPVRQGRAREDDYETPKTAGVCCLPNAVAADSPNISKPQTWNRTRMDAYDLPEPMLPSDDDEAMGDGTSYTTRQPEPCSDQEMDDEQAQTSTCKKRTAAAPRRKQVATPKNYGIEPLTPGTTEELARCLRTSQSASADRRWTAPPVVAPGGVQLLHSGPRGRTSSNQDHKLPRAVRTARRRHVIDFFSWRATTAGGEPRRQVHYDGSD